MNTSTLSPYIKKSPSFMRRLRLLLAAAAVLIPASAHAQDTWTNTGDWVNNPGNWSSTVPPTTTINAVISNGSSVTVSTPANQAVAMDIDNQGSIEVVSGGVLSSTTLTNEGAGILTIDAGGALNVSGQATLDGGSLLTLGDGVNFSPGSVALTNSAGIAVTVAVNGTDTATISSVIQDGDTSDALAVVSSGTLILSGANTYSGGTAITTAQVVAENSSALGTGVVSLNNATLTATDGVSVGNAINVDSGGTIGNSGSGAAATYTGTITLSSDLTIFSTSGGGAGGSTTVTGGITGTGNVTLNSGTSSADTSTITISGANVDNVGTVTNSGSGTGGTTISSVIDGNVTGVIQNSATSSLTLTGQNTYTGATTIEAGALVIGTGGSIADSSSVSLTNSGTTFDISGAGSTQIINNLSGVAGSTVSLGGNNLTVENSGDNTFAGVIQDGGDGGSFTLTGSGVLTLSGPNTYSGGTTIDGGTLEVASESNLGTGAITLGGGELLTSTTTTLDEDVALNNGTTNTLAAVTGTTATYSGTLADGNASGALTVGDTTGSDNGTVVLGGTNTYTGGTTITSGTLEISSEDNIGGAQAGGVTLNGGELLTSATTTIAEGVTLNNGTTNTLGAVTGTTATYNGNINDGNGVGALTVGDTTGSDNGIIVLGGNNSYSGGTTITSGTLEVASESNLGTGALTLNGGELLTSTTTTLDENVALNNGTANTLAAVTGTTATYSGVLADGTGGAGSLAIGDSTGNNDGTVTLTGVNTYTGTTTINSGTLALGTGGSIADSGEVNLANTGTTFDISGAGNQSINNLNGVAGSTVNLGANGLTVTNGASSSNTFAGVITDGGNGGSLTVAGTGLLTLTGANTYSGGTTINGGDLIAGNSTALGTGNVSNIGSSSTPSLLASNSYITGTALSINVGGNYTQGANGTLYLSVTGTGGVAGTDYDTLAVAGTANLGGTLSLNFTSTSVPVAGERFVVVSSGSPLTGTFADTETNLDGYKLAMTYDNTFGGTEPADSAIATLLLQFSDVAALTPNQRSVATYVDQNDLTVTNGDFFNKIVAGLNAASLTPGQLEHALDDLSPQRLQMFSTVAFNNFTFATQSLDDHLANLRDGAFGLDVSGLTVNDPTLDPSLSQIRSRLLAWNPSSSPGLISDSDTSVLSEVKPSDPKAEAPSQPANPSDKNWSAFVSGNVVLGDVSHNNDISHSNYTTGGATAGVDYRITTNLRAGVLMAYDHTDADLDNEGSKAHIDTYQPGVYLSYADKSGFYANGLFSYAYNSYSEDRTIQFAGVNRTATGSPNGNQYGFDLDGGYDFHREAWTFGPALGLTYVNLGVNSFSESGAQSADLNVNDQSAESLRSRLGANIRYSAKVGSVILNPHFSAFWLHEYLDDSRTITSQMQQGGLAGSFGVQTTSPDRDSALLGLGIDAEFNSTLTLFLDYQADVGQDYVGQSAQGGVKLAF